MQLTSIRAKNFLSFGNDTEQIDLKDLNIVVGPNNSGKTNLFRAINFVGDVFANRIQEFTTYYHNADFEHPFEVSIGIHFSDEETEALSNFLVCSGLVGSVNRRPNEYEDAMEALKRDLVMRLGKEFFAPLFENVTLIVRGQSQESYPVITSIKIADSGRELYVHDYGTISRRPTPARNYRYATSFPDMLIDLLREREPARISDFLEKRTFHMPRLDRLPTNPFDFVFSKLADTPEVIVLHIDGINFRGIEQRIGAVQQLIKLRTFLAHRGFAEDGLNIFQLITTIYNSSIIRTSNIRSKPRAFLNPQETLGALTITTDLSGGELPSVLFRLKNSTSPKERSRYSKILGAFKQITGSSEFDVGIRTRLLSTQAINELTVIDPSRFAVRGDIGSVSLQGEEGIKFLGIRTKEGEMIQYELVTQVVDGDMAVPLDFAAAGLFESLILLVALLGHERKVILLDEPALNLHPILQKRFLELVKQAISNNNQIAMITHSPYFIDYNVVAKTDATISTNLLYVRKQRNSSVILMPDNIELNLKPHLFRPEIFFSRCNIIVEGAADLATLAAISEGYDGILGRHDIALIDTWGKGGVKKYLPLLNSYKIPFVAMVDSGYEGPKDDNIIILEEKLEDELRKLGWNLEGKRGHVEPQEAYEFISSIVKEQNGKQQIRTSIFWRVIESALAKTGTNTP